MTHTSALYTEIIRLSYEICVENNGIMESLVDSDLNKLWHEC